MYKLCKTEQSAVRQRQLEMGLLEAMGSTPYEDISISNLCDQLQIPRKSFYRYFSGKDGALMALVDHTLMEFEETTAGKSRRNSAMEDLQQYFVFWYEHRELLEVLQKNRLNSVLVERAVEHAKLENIMPSILRICSEDAQAIALTFLVSGLISVVFQWYRGGYKQSPSEMVNAISWFLSRPLLHR